ncbi:hypothetical protein [Sulfurimonas sp.]|uniref:hypothetical protein n=1 Tax=Sulfurimonas sp. TaxID=2022749 RepID=UPI002620B12A|nr:hypothetical protein [Sulfurimonas sp.]MDD5156552.1 hypothetical protein [Sulfurimonas sp.]
MLNINDLENRHKKYKLKLYTPYIVIFILVIFILLLAYFVMINIYSSTQAEKMYAEQNKTVSKNRQEYGANVSTVIPATATEDNASDKNRSNKEGQINEISSNNKIIFTPSFEFIKNIQLSSSKSSIIDPQITRDKISLVVPVIAPVKKEEITVDITPVQKKQTTKIENKASEKITINKENSDIQDVIKRFNINKNPALSLFIAKKYYQLADYEHSYNYALTTNGIDSNIDESWIIFAKSLVKLNQREKAIQTLEQYVSSTKSQNAKIFLDDLKSGKFK